MEKKFHQDLELAARRMIQVQRVDTLVRLILRTIARRINIQHAGVFFYDPAHDGFTVRISNGEKGEKVPAGFARVARDNPLIRYFTDPRYSAYVDQRYLLRNRCAAASSARRPLPDDIVSFLSDVQFELALYKAYAFIPCFYRKNLIALLFIGRKKNGGRLTAEELDFLSVLASDMVMALQNARLFEDLNRQLDINKRLLLNTVTALAAAIEAKDAYTMGHTERVAAYACEIGQHIVSSPQSAGPGFMENLRIAALLHDIGKIGIPGSILNKQGILSDEERAVIEKHPLIGTEILQPIHEFQPIILGVTYHHERFDGFGYPEKLSGDRIPLIAAILAVADAYDAMTSDRPYRKAFTAEQAVAEIQRNSGHQFAPEVVKAFLAIEHRAAPLPGSALSLIRNMPQSSGSLQEPDRTTVE